MNIRAQRFATKTVNPLRRQGVATLFSTRPPLTERVRRLRTLDGEQALVPAAA
jgi:Zn-dependent protease with chaperone function